MFTLTVGDVVLEAETLAQVTKLGKKEEKRQKEARKRQDEYRELAMRDAWCQFGKIAYFLTCPNYKFWFREMEFSGQYQTGDEENCKLFARTEAGQGFRFIHRGWLMPTACIENPAGYVEAIRLRNRDGEALWYATGVHQSDPIEPGILYLSGFPDEYGKKLEAAYQESLIKKAA